MFATRPPGATVVDQHCRFGCPLIDPRFVDHPTDLKEGANLNDRACRTKLLLGPSCNQVEQAGSQDGRLYILLSRPSELAPWRHTASGNMPR